MAAGNEQSPEGERCAHQAKQEWCVREISDCGLDQILVGVETARNVLRCCVGTERSVVQRVGEEVTEAAAEWSPFGCAVLLRVVPPPFKGDPVPQVSDYEQQACGGAGDPDSEGDATPEDGFWKGPLKET